jgi:hypothetical protein
MKIQHVTLPQLPSHAAPHLLQDFLPDCFQLLPGGIQLLLAMDMNHLRRKMVRNPWRNRWITHLKMGRDSYDSWAEMSHDFPEFHLV